jgi:hypothetical protein
MDETRRIASTLVQAVHKLQGQASDRPGRHTAALHTLAMIFQAETDKIARVDSPVTQTSTTPTDTATVRAAPRRHQKNTRQNKPGTTPPIIPPATTPIPQLNSEGAQRTKRPSTTAPAPPLRACQLQPAGDHRG